MHKRRISARLIDDYGDVASYTNVHGAAYLREKNAIGGRDGFERRRRAVEPG
jgi:hypothetical protein